MLPNRDDRPGAWGVYRGTGEPHDGIDALPDPPAWRTFNGGPPVSLTFGEDPEMQRRLGPAGNRAYRPDDHVIDLTRYTFSWRAIANRFRANRTAILSGLNVTRAISSEGSGRIAYYTEVRRRLDTDRQVQRYFDRETDELPAFYVDQVRKDLGPLWEWLPQEAMSHDSHAYRKSEDEPPQAIRAQGARAELQMLDA